MPFEGMKKGRRGRPFRSDWLRGEDSNLHTRIQSPVCCPLHHPAGPFFILHRACPSGQAEAKGPGGGALRRHAPQ